MGKNNPLDQDSLFEQFATITKAHAYDIVRGQNKQLQLENTVMRNTLNAILFGIENKEINNLSQIKPLVELSLELLTTDNVNLGKYDLNKLWRNPMLIHRIQDNLMEIKEETFLAEEIRKAAKNDINGCIKMVISQYRDNPEMIKRIVDKETIELIEEFAGITRSDDLTDINI